MLAILATILSGVISGGATGLLGVLIQRYFDLKGRDRDIEIVKLNLANSVALATVESDRAKMRADADVAVADRDAAAREDEAAGRSLVASYENDRAQYLDAAAQRRPGRIGGIVTLLMGLVDFLRGLLRPGLTIYLTAIVTFMFMHVTAILGVQGYTYDSVELVKLLAQIVATVLYCFTTCVVWWFGSRPTKKQD